MDVIETAIEVFDVLSNREEVGVDDGHVVVVVLVHVSVIVKLWLVEVQQEGVLLRDLGLFPSGGVRGPQSRWSRGGVRFVSGLDGLLALNRVATSRDTRNLGCKGPDGFCDHPLDR